jgi:hypothetical protein
MLRMNEATQIEVHIVNSTEPPGGHRRDRHVCDLSGHPQCDLGADWQAPAQDAGRRLSVEGGLTGSRAAIS